MILSNFTQTFILVQKYLAFKIETQPGLFGCPQSGSRTIKDFFKQYSSKNREIMYRNVCTKIFCYNPLITLTFVFVVVFVLNRFYLKNS